MKYRIVHVTRYHYEQTVAACLNQTHLSPRSTMMQNCWESAVDISPGPNRRHAFEDYFGNSVLYFEVNQPHSELEVTATALVDVRAHDAWRDTAHSPAWDSIVAGRTAWPAEHRRDAHEFRLDSPLIAADGDLAALARPSFPPGRPLLAAVAELSDRIHREFSYAPAATTVSTPIATVLQERRGVCQDFAQLAIGCLRSLGLPARYVSGYIELRPAPGAAPMIGAAASHAWFSVLDPVFGWVDFDPTNDQLVGPCHVTTAWGRDYSDVTPLKGVIFGGGNHTLEVSVDMRRVD